MCLQIFLEGSNWTGWTDRQRQVVPKRRGTRVKSSSTSIGLDPGDWQTITIVWSHWKGRNRCSQHGMEINRLFFTQGFVGKQIDLKKYSKPYWQPMKRTKQWNTVSKWRRVCHQADRLILYTLKPSEVNVSNTIQRLLSVIDVLLTDRHRQIVKWMVQNYQHTFHQMQIFIYLFIYFCYHLCDVWYVTKREVLGMTLNCIRWQGSISGVLEFEGDGVPLSCHYSQVYSGPKW